MNKESTTMKTKLLKTLKEVYNGRNPEEALEEVFSLFGVSLRITLVQEFYESEDSKTGWETDGWFTEDGQIFIEDKYELSEIIDQDKFGNITKAVFVYVG